MPLLLAAGPLELSVIAEDIVRSTKKPMILQLSETLSLSFAVWHKGTEDDVALKALMILPEIWEGQRRDCDNVEQVAEAEFHNCLLAIFRLEGQAIGYLLFEPRCPELAVQHTGFLEKHRGSLAIKCIEHAHREVFLRTSVTHILTHCPEWSMATASLARKMGGEAVSFIKSFAIRDGRMQGARLYELSCITWARLNHTDFQEQGEKWHEQVFAKIEPHHEDDPAHNGFLGLALEMGKYQPHKAMAIYNNWAERAGYLQGELIWSNRASYSFVDFGHGFALNGPDGIVAVLPKCQPLPQSPPGSDQSPPPASA